MRDWGPCWQGDVRCLRWLSSLVYFQCAKGDCECFVWSVQGCGFCVSSLVLFFFTKSCCTCLLLVLKGLKTFASVLCLLFLLTSLLDDTVLCQSYHVVFFVCFGGHKFVLLLPYLLLSQANIDWGSVSVSNSAALQHLHLVHGQTSRFHTSSYIRLQPAALYAFRVFTDYWGVFIVNFVFNRRFFCTMHVNCLVSSTILYRITESSRRPIP